MGTIEVNGVKLNFEEIGTGPTVVLVHGIPTDYRVWRAQVDGLSKDFRTISYSRRCALPNQRSDYGNSTVENNAKDLEELIVRTGSGPAHIIGHSYGGSIVALFALRHPELVRSLVLIEPYLPKMVVDQDSMINSLSLLIRKPSVAMSGLKSLDYIKATQQEVSQKNREKALDTFYSNSWERRDVKFQLSEPARTMMLDNIETFKELLIEAPTFNKKDAARIKPPALILAGEYTIKYMKEVAQELHRTIPNNRIVTIRNAAHYPHIENPKECNDAILKFLSEHAR